MEVLIEVSARHIHLSKEDLENLFGKGYQLTRLKQLTQPSDFAAKETLDIKTEKSILRGLRIVGPTRKKTQLELSITDNIFLGIETSLRDSGDLKGTPGITLIGPKGELRIKEGVIVPLRHIHCNFDEAKKLKLKNGQLVSVLVEGKRELVFHKVKVRVGEGYKLCMHIDTDEGNAAGIIKSAKGTIIKS